MYTSLKTLYKDMMFPKNPNAPKFTMSEIDEMDFGFFEDLMDVDQTTPQDKEVYLSDVW